MGRRKACIIGCRSNPGNRAAKAAVMLADLDSQMKTNIICIINPSTNRTMIIRTRLSAALLTLALLAFEPALAQDGFTIVFKDHRIVPAELTVPAGQKFTLIVDNQDSTPEEFESHSLKREKVVGGNSKVTVQIGPLKPGTYEIFGEYHESTAQGRIVAK
jgi:hypothetical protein